MMMIRDRWLAFLVRCCGSIGLLLLIGCTGGPSTLRTPVKPTGWPPPRSVVATPTPVPSTSTPIPSPTADVDYVRIKNSATGKYLIEVDQLLKLGQWDHADLAAQWVVEDYQGSKRIRNRASGDYISIEHLQKTVEVIPIEAVWMSPRWTFSADPAQGPIALRNVWHNWEVLYTADTDFVHYGRPPADKEAASWQIETIGGNTLAVSTPTLVVVLPTPAQSQGRRGAATPWIEYEAEDGKTNGAILGPDRAFGTIASESSGRRSVELKTRGQYLQFKSAQSANSIVVRYVIPDAPMGGGITATLSLYVNGTFRQKLTLTSRYAWSYGGEQYTFNEPAAGGAHHFFDEARALVDNIPAGALVKFQKDADDTAAYYVIDLVDLEQVEAPKMMPDGFLSITTDCGATPNDGSDDGPAIQSCVDQARAQKKGVWIPVGTFESSRVPINASDVTVSGAGMWYSIVHGLAARFNCTGSNCRYADFAILGETVTRDDQSPENGFSGAAGTGSRLENIWVEHTKVGYWVGDGYTAGLIIINSRFRNLFADGVNFCNGTSHSLIENSHFRNTGDDALASWSPSSSIGVNTQNVFRFNTVQVPWRANCFAIYGGQDNRIEDNLCYDVVTYPGILIAQSFKSHPFAGTTTIQRNSLIRAGGSMFRQEHGALKIEAEQGPVTGVVVKDVTIDSATFSGIELEGSYPISTTLFDNIQIISPGAQGLLIRSNAAGHVIFSNVVITEAGKEAVLNVAPNLFFALVQGSGNVGW